MDLDDSRREKWVCPCRREKCGFVPEEDVHKE